MVEPYAATRLDALRKLRREGYAVIAKDEGGQQATVWVLLKETGDTTKVHAIYEDRADLMARIERIGKANSQYRMREAGHNRWRVGPEDDEDEGFFGNKPVDLRAVEVAFHRAKAAARGGSDG